MAKATFTAERSRQFDILQAKEAIFLGVDGCSERASELSMPGYRTLYFQLSHFYVHFYYIALVL